MHYDNKSAEKKERIFAAKIQIHCRWNLCRLILLASCSILNARQLVNSMKKVLLATVAILAFAAPSLAADSVCGYWYRWPGASGYHVNSGIESIHT
jgi:hypothetical protein